MRAPAQAKVCLPVKLLARGGVLLPSLRLATRRITFPSWLRTAVSRSSWLEILLTTRP